MVEILDKGGSMNEGKLMDANKSGNFDFSKLKEVSRDSIEAKLYQIIDDIDTATDMFKPKKQGFEKYVYRKIEEAHRHIVSDGYKLYYAGEEA